MANKPSSLLDDAEFGNIGKSKDQRGKAKGGESNSQTGKIILVIVCFVIAGAGIAYTFWPEGQPESAKPGGKGSLTSSDQEAAKKQEQKVKEDLEKPELFHGPS
jgi:flagellar basal body-associated protein FliL